MFNRSCRKIINSILCLILMFSVFPCTASAQQTELQTIRVGFFAFDGYHMSNDSDIRTGYGYDILQHMAGYTDWKYKYIGYDKSWSEMQDMLEEGKIDILTSAQKTPERMQKFDFSKRAIGTSSAILTVKAGNSNYIFKDYKNWDGMRVGLLRDNSRNEHFAKYAAKKGFSYIPVYFDDTDAMSKALKSGKKIDAMLTSNLRSISDEWILAEFNASPFYIIVKKSNTRLLREINSALDQLLTDEPNLCTDLMKKYYTPDSSDEISFTTKERAYIQKMNNNTFTAIINPGTPPFSYSKNGKSVGIINDIASEIIKRSGLNIKIADTKANAEYNELANSGNTAICFDAAYDYGQAEKMGYRLTAPYLETPIAKLYRKDNDNFSSLALLKDGISSNKCNDHLKKEFEDVTYYENTEELINAVSSSKQDVAYIYKESSEYAVQTDVANRLVAENMYDHTASFAVAVSRNQDPMLFSILNKTVASINTDDIQNIVSKHTSDIDTPFSLVALMYDNPFMLLLIVIGIFLIIILATVLHLQARKRKREAADLIEEKRRSELLSDALATAEKADAAKSQFLSRVSHEMRTPLNAIIGFLSLAKDSSMEQTKTYMSHSEIAAKQLLSVINDVLDMSSIEAGKMKISHAPFDFKHLINSITNIYIEQCHEKGLEYETKLLTPVDEWLIGDPLRVNQILMNLLSNALKFTNSGHVWLKVSQQNAQNEKVFVRFEVSDTGCGMSDELRSRLFKPFEQESAETAQKYGGSGLGLSIVYNLTSMMNGAVSVKSTYGEGSTFTVDLPFDKSKTNLDIELPENMDTLHVMVVDDESRECDYVSVILDRLNIRHTCIEDSREVLAELTRAAETGEPYNVCLIDWKMPDMDGMELTKQIRQKYSKNVVLIVVSAYEHNQAGDHATNAGANLFVPKPLFQSSLIDLFMTITDGHMAKEQNADTNYDFTGRRVLLAEDNAMNCMVAEGIIGRFGIECETAVDGQEALDMFIASKPGHYDAILMDIQMPNMDGFEATSKIRGSSHPDAQKIQIIALTANAFTEDISKALSQGMNAHVAKPIEPKILASTLDKAFHVKKSS